MHQFRRFLKSKKAIIKSHFLIARRTFAKLEKIWRSGNFDETLASLGSGTLQKVNIFNGYWVLFRKFNSDFFYFARVNIVAYKELKRSSERV